MTRPYGGRVSQMEIPYIVRDGAVYWGQKQLESADVATFHGLSNVCAVDKSKVLTEWRPRRIHRWAKCYARDADSVYYHDQMTGKASVVRGADPRTFVSLGNRFGKDATSVYFEKLKLPGAVAAKWFCPIMNMSRLRSLARPEVIDAAKEM